MAFKNVRYSRAISELFRIATNVDIVMRNSAKQYRAIQTQIENETDPARITILQQQALFSLRHGATRPSFVQSRIRRFISNLAEKEGSQANALAIVDGIINVMTGGTATRQEITAELTALRVHEDAIIDGVKNQGWSLDDVAAYIEANIEDNNDLLEQPHETTYTQGW